jgi:hypothetical protein
VGNNTVRKQRKTMKGNQIMKNRNNAITTMVLALGFLALSPIAQAVIPAPDGGYPGGNTAEGQAALLSLTTGGFDTAVGYLSLRSDASGSYNTAVGAGALLATTGDENTATGAGALLSNTGGHFNTAIGYTTFFQNSTGSENVALGAFAGGGVTTATNVICIGYSMLGTNVNNSCYIGNIFGSTSSGGTAVFVNTNGRLGTVQSYRRFKDGIKPMEQASESLFALKPVTFHYKKEIDPAGTSQLGLVAEDVEKVNSDLVVRDKEGKPYSVRYDQVNAMLLNEFLKEHRKVEKLEATVAALASQLQRVTAQVEMSHSAARVVASNQ